MVCPICNKEFKLEESLAPPFCSRRCREIDLGRWLDEAYQAPVPRHSPDEEDEQNEFPPAGSE